MVRGDNPWDHTESNMTEWLTLSHNIKKIKDAKHTNKSQSSVCLFQMVVSKCMCMCSVVSESLWPCGLYSLPGSSIHGSFQARILEEAAISFSRGSFQHKEWTQVSCIFCTVRQILYQWAPWEVHLANTSSQYSVQRAKHLFWLPFKKVPGINTVSCTDL